MILNRTLSSMFLQGTVFQTASPFVHPSPRLRPGLLSLRSVQASSLITSKREEKQGAHPKEKDTKKTESPLPVPSFLNINLTKFYFQILRM